MNNLSGDFGYIHPANLPEPDSPLTVKWGETIAKGVGRITSYGFKEGNLAGGSVFYGVIPGSNADYNGVPILKGYYKSGTAWSDYEFLGSLGAIEGVPAGKSFLGFQVNDGPLDKLRFEWGTLAGTTPNNRTTQYVILSYGR